MNGTTKGMEFLIAHDFNNLADIPDDQELVIQYLLHRYGKGKIYSWVGPLLLALNPNHPISNLYNQERYKQNGEPINIPRTECEPHVFAVAAYARFKLVRDLGSIHQMILISGDSGSGKTFSASSVLNFLVSSECDGDSVSSMLSKIGSACSLISAFGTASTERNMHSSRHGQLVQLQYVNNVIAGAVLNSFLLEQTRVTSGRNNFHIFNQILAGASETELDMLKLRRNSAYTIVNTVAGITHEDHVKWYRNTIDAMNRLGIETTQSSELIKVLAVLIHLGNIEFEEKATAVCNVDSGKKESVEGLEAACDLIILSTSELQELLTTTLISAQSRLRRRSNYRRAIGSVEACKGRLYSIIRYLYQRLFHWLVNRINAILACSHENSKLLGILDIFGFEYFSKNSIEQLSINYVNERLQSHFIKEYLHAGRLQTEEEGLTVISPSTSSALSSYQQRISVIEGDLFPALNDVCVVDRIQKDLDIPLTLQSSNDEKKKYIKSHGDIFVIDHYSCPVTYNTTDILSKNTDKVPAELLSTFKLCKNHFILSLLEDDDNESEANGRNNIKKKTWLAKLKQSMDALVKELDKYDLHYIRCIKPTESIDKLTMTKEFQKQLACSGILDALSIARCTLPIRLKYDELFKRYFRQMSKNSDPIKIFKIFLTHNFNDEEVGSLIHFGSRRIFLAEKVLLKLELWRDTYRSSAASKIQKYWFKYRTKRKIQFFELSSKNQFSKTDKYNQASSQDAADTKKSVPAVVNENLLNNDNKISKATENDTSVLAIMDHPSLKIDNIENDHPSHKKITCTKQTDESRCQLHSTSQFPLATRSVSNESEWQNSLVNVNNETFFYGNRIFSRRCLADVPVRFHTKLTCLLNSHRLPRSELPRGLQDSL